MKTLIEEYNDELTCYFKCLKESERSIKQKNLYDAGVFLDSASRSLKELSRLQQEITDLENGKVTITFQQLGFQKDKRQ